VSVDGAPVEAQRINGEGWVMLTCLLPTGRHEVCWREPEAMPAQPFAARQYTVETYFVREAQLVPVRVAVEVVPGTQPPVALPETPCAGIQRSTWIGPKVAITPEGSPLEVAVSAEDLEHAQAAKLHISVFGSQGGDDYGRKWVLLNGERVASVPVNSSANQPDRWEGFALDLTPEQMTLLRPQNEIAIETETGDCFKLADLALAVQLADGRWAETEHSRGVWCSAAGWLHEEGTLFSGKTAPIRLRFRR
jgi:hypothetical protein